MPDFLAQFARDLADAMRAVDARAPVAERAGGKGTFQPGIGPLPEDAVVELCTADLCARDPARYGAHARAVAYPGGSRARCDLCFGHEPAWDWAIEIKLLRFLGDNGKPNGNMLMHILSPYAQDRSALTDCSKLAAAPIAARKAVVIFGYPHADWPLEPAIEAFELLAGSHVRLGPRHTAFSEGLIHPVHRTAQVFAWEVSQPGTVSGPRKDQAL